MVKVPLQYVESVLETSGDDFESTDDLYEAIGEVGFSKSGREVDKVELLWNYCGMRWIVWNNLLSRCYMRWRRKNRKRT